jgi:hypothetical protein
MEEQLSTVGYWLGLRSWRRITAQRLKLVEKRRDFR